MTDPCTQDSIDSRECNSESENDTENVLSETIIEVSDETDFDNTVVKTVISVYLVIYQNYSVLYLSNG
jgi:hypothetical protein